MTDTGDDGFVVFAEAKFLANEKDEVRFEFTCGEGIDRRLVADMMEDLARQIRASTEES